MQRIKICLNKVSKSSTGKTWAPLSSSSLLLNGKLQGNYAAKDFSSPASQGNHSRVSRLSVACQYGWTRARSVGAVVGARTPRLGFGCDRACKAARCQTRSLEGKKPPQLSQGSSIPWLTCLTHLQKFRWLQTPRNDYTELLCWIATTAHGRIIFCYWGYWFDPTHFLTTGKNRRPVINKRGFGITIFSFLFEFYVYL